MAAAIQLEDESRARADALDAHARAGGDPNALATLVKRLRKNERMPARWKANAWFMASDSLAALEIERVRSARRIADIGSGTGFPGLVLASVLPQARVTLLETRITRSRFLHGAIAAMRLTNVEVLTKNVQEWADGSGTCDIVTVRNVVRPSIALEFAAPVLAPGGATVLWRRRRVAAVEADGEAAAAATGFRQAEIRQVGHKRYLYVFEKVAATPAHLPRPPGAARRHPIRAEIQDEDRLPDPAAVRLSPPQQELLKLVARGAGDPEMCASLILSRRELRQQMRRIRKKLGAYSRAEAVARARSYGLLP